MQTTAHAIEAPKERDYLHEIMEVADEVAGYVQVFADGFLPMHTLREKAKVLRRLIGEERKRRVGNEGNNA